jgi:pyruvate,water dikinase
LANVKKGLKMTLNKTIKNIIWLKDCSEENILQVGGKNANLGRMLKLGIRVPPGFAVNTSTFDNFLDRTGIRHKIVNLLFRISIEDLKTVEEVGAQVRNLIELTEVPKEIFEEIKESYERLCDLCKVQDLPVAIRSSATSEDLAIASFAGQHETYLGVRKVDNVTRHILKCWASLFTDRAIAYRSRMGWPQDKVTISVGIQKMVNAKCAGVMFTIDPISGDQDKIIIEGNWGLGESVVSGKVNVDMYVVNKKNLKIIEKKLGDKRIQMVAKGEKIVEEELTEEKQNAYVLNDEEIIEVTKMGKILESYFGCPQDIEWAIDTDIPFPDNVFFLQTRPIVGGKVKKPKTTEEKVIDELMKVFFSF